MFFFNTFDNSLRPHPVPILYPLQLKYWLIQHPWVSVGNHIFFPLHSKILKTPTDIKKRTNINGPVTVKGSRYVAIGKYCDIAENLYIISSNHSVDKPNIQANLQNKFNGQLDVSKGPVYIGNNVWIGDNVTILSGVRIGDGAVLGAGSVVTQDIPPFAIAVGVPARVIKYRFPSDVIQELLSISWWHWEEKTIQNNKSFFTASVKKSNIQRLKSRIDLDTEKEMTHIDMKKKNTSTYLLDGWGMCEGGFRWMEKQTAGFVFKTSKQNSHAAFSFSGRSLYKQQYVTFIINNIFRIRVLLSNIETSYTLRIKGIQKGINTIRIIARRGRQPNKIYKGSSDARLLFCMFSWFSLEI